MFDRPSSRCQSHLLCPHYQGSKNNPSLSYMTFSASLHPSGCLTLPASFVSFLAAPFAIFQTSHIDKVLLYLPIPFIIRFLLKPGAQNTINKGIRPHETIQYHLHLLFLRMPDRSLEVKSRHSSNSYSLFIAYCISFLSFRA